MDVSALEREYAARQLGRQRQQYNRPAAGNVQTPGPGQPARPFGWWWTPPLRNILVPAGPNQAHNAMSKEPIKSPKRLLEPYERISEVLFGLIMVLTFTGSLSVANAGHDDVRAMLIGALLVVTSRGASLTVSFYLMGCLSEQGRGIRSLWALRKGCHPGGGAPRHC